MYTYMMTRIKWKNHYIAALILAIVAFQVPTCAFSGELVSVSGKVVYKEYAIEEAEVTAKSGEDFTATVKSGYHGDFLMKLPEGVYDLTAKGLIKPGLLATGILYGLVIPPNSPRVDRLIIHISPAEAVK